jgi:DNA-binding transcriptional LysR family regulator
MDTTLLRTFVAVARGSSFTAAARELGYVQSTVTGHVQQLERRLDGPLLDRLPGGAVLTDAGRRLLPYAERMLALEAEMTAVVPDDAALAGPVAVAAPESLCAYRLPELIGRLRAELPSVRLTVSPSLTPAALAAVRAGRADVALVAGNALTAGDLVMHRVGAEPLLLLGSPELAGTRTRWSWPDLAGHDVLLLEEGCSYSDGAARQLATAGQSELRQTRFGSVEAVKHCVAAGLGWTVLPAIAARTELAAGTLVPLAGPRLESCQVFVARNPGRHVGAALQAVIERLPGLWPSATTGAAEPAR